MKNKTPIVILFSIFLTFLVISPVSAFFTKSHEYWTIKGFEEIDSPITQLCSDKLSIVLDGNTAADVPVLHYFDEEFMSYVSTHTRYSGYQKCLELAGTDPDLKCFCYGYGLHNVQDHFSHTENGLVPKYLKNYFSSNLVGHMTVEKSFEDKHMKLVSDSSVITSGKLSYYDSIVLDNLFEETGGNYKYFELMEDISSLDMRNDANIFANGYKGKGFYNTVYNEKLNLPWWFWGLSIGLMIVGWGLALLFMFFGKSNWKYLLVLTYFIIGLIGALILISFFTNNTWQWVRFAVSLVPITVSDSDIQQYDSLVQSSTNNFLITGDLKFDDNSGLSYVDRNGNSVEGALKKAESRFVFILFPITLILFIINNIFVIYKTFKNKSKNK